MQELYFKYTYQGIVRLHVMWSCKKQLRLFKCFPMKGKNIAIFLSIVVLFYQSVCLAEESFSVSYLTPAYEDSPFYITMGNIMRAVSEDLGIKFDMVYGKNSTLRAKRLGLDLIKSHKPDYFLTGYYNDVSHDYLEYTKKTGTKIFFITAQPPASAYKIIGKPRQKYPQWIGQLTPNDKEYGYLLADKLIELAIKAGLKDDKGKVNIIALAGTENDIVSEQRVSGLAERIGQSNEAVLLHTALTGWVRDSSYKATLALLRQYPATHIVWAVSDDLAGGAIEAAEKLGRQPGSDILFGGMNLSQQAINNIEAGRQAVSIDGHFLEAAWALVMLYDYHHGVDFPSGTGYIFNTKPYVLTIENVQFYKENFLITDWNKIDFRRLSKRLHPEMGKYDFSLEAFHRIIESQLRP